MRRFLTRCANLFHRRRAEREMTREIDSHLALIQENFERAGMPPHEAALAARRAYGGVEQSKELHRDARSFVWVEQFVKDIRYACRSLLRAPGFTLVAALTLALGLGVNVTLFAIYDAVAVRPLPVADPDRLMRLKPQPEQGDDQFSWEEYEYLRGHAGTLSGLAASYGGPGNDALLLALAQIGESAARERVLGHAVTANYFALLGEVPRLGRFFRPEEDRIAGGNPVVVLAWRFWQRRFQGDAGVIGRSFKLNGLPYTIIGIAPEHFTGTDLSFFEFDFWAPLSMIRQLDPASQSPAPGDRSYQVLARLKNGVSLAQAQAELSLLLRQYLAAARAPGRTTGITLEQPRYLDLSDPGDRAEFDATAAAMWIVVCLILGSACANVANMLLARGASRQREIGIRLAMGASRARVIRQLLLESVLLAVFGGIAAIPLSVIAGKSFWLSLSAIFRTMNLGMRQLDIRPEGQLLAYGMLLSIVTGVVFGLAPALRFTRLDLNRALKEEGSVFGAHFRRSRLRAVLLGSQAAVSLLLLLVGGAMMKKAHDATVSDLGFDVRSPFVLDGVSGPDQACVDMRALRARIANLPEIAGTALADPPSGNDDNAIPMRAGKWNRKTFVSTVSDGYFGVMGMRLERGRDFTRQEIASHAAVAVITASTARNSWPNADPLGKLVSLTFPGQSPKSRRANFKVIGVVNDVRQADLIRIDPARVYLPSDARPSYSLIFRIRAGRAKALAAVQAAIDAADPKLMPGLQLHSVEDGDIAVTRGMYRWMAGVAGILTLLAMALGVVGIYGVMAFLVSQRTREIGIRMALGASAGMLLRNIVLQGLRPVAVGMALGFAAALGVDAWNRSTDLLPETMLHRVFGSPAVCAEVALMLAVAALASAIPARRALRVDPAGALRHE